MNVTTQPATQGEKDLVRQGIFTAHTWGKARAVARFYLSRNTDRMSLLVQDDDKGLLRATFTN